MQDLDKEDPKVLKRKLARAVESNMILQERCTLREAKIDQLNLIIKSLQIKLDCVEDIFANASEPSLRRNAFWKV